MLKILEPYCRRIRMGGKHIVFYPYHTSRIITMSMTSSDGMWYKQLYKEFAREGVRIVELEKYLHRK